MSKPLYTEDQLIKAINLARLNTDGKEDFYIGDVSGCAEVCSYDNCWEEKYTDEQIKELIDSL